MAKKKNRKRTKRPPLPAGGTARAQATETKPKPGGKGYTAPKAGATPKRGGAAAQPQRRRGGRLSPTAQ